MSISLPGRAVVFDYGEVISFTPSEEDRARMVAAAGVPVFAWKGMDEQEFWDCIEATVRGPDGWTPNMILDDGGDLTKLMHDKYPDRVRTWRGQAAALGRGRLPAARLCIR